MCLAVRIKILFGDYEDIKPVLDAYQSELKSWLLNRQPRNSAVGLLDIKHLDARIEPGDHCCVNVTIGSKAVIMMGAILNISTTVGEATMIDMGGNHRRLCTD